MVRRLLLFLTVVAVTLPAAYAALINGFLPCRRPISYSLAAIDERFNLPEEHVRSALLRAEKLWEDATGIDLLALEEDGTVAVNLVYDDRQRIGDQLTELGLKLDDSKKTYDSLLKSYDELHARFLAAQDEYKKARAAYDKRRRAYEVEVARLNEVGATRADVDRMEDERSALNAQGTALNRKRDAIDALMDDVNAVAQRLQDLGPEINGGVDEYNAIGKERGTEFQAGDYVRDASGQRIDVYLYQDADQLTRILAHEFGHALGLDHVKEELAIMHELNKGKATELSDADVRAIRLRCGL